MSSAQRNHLDRSSHFRPSSSSDIEAHRDSSVSCCLSEVDLESGDLKLKELFGDKVSRDCRICHLGLENHGPEYGVAIELGCSCKGDLGAAHRKCAETWFKIKGNSICEICGATAINVSSVQVNESHSATAAALSSAPAAPMILVETRTFCHSRRMMNFLLACLVFAFVISWLFHFHILS